MRRGWSLALLFFSACASQPPFPEAPPLPRDPVVRENEADVVVIDLQGLHRSLGLERLREDLGYAEKTFETCEAGYGYSASRDCRRDVMVSIYFQILCRDSEGTVSTAVSRDDMTPLSGRTLTWTLQGVRGTMRLDGEGFGQIKTIYRRSQKGQRLKLAVDNDFVYIRAEEVKRLVTPRNWCD